MRSTTYLWLLLVAGAGLAAFPYAPAWAQSYSHARIVRLSFVEGTVAVERPDLTEWAAAPVNTPLQEGFKLSTAENSFAEVEFEDASATRLGQLTMLDFTQLAVEPSGAKLNRLALGRGYATFQVSTRQGDLYELKAGDVTLTVVPGTQVLFRVDLDESFLRVEVFNGQVEVSSVFGASVLGPDKVLEIRSGGDRSEKEYVGITKDGWDEWVEQREKQSVPLESRRQPGLYSNDVSTLLYGWNDLWNYGSWSYIPGYHCNAWVPRVAGGWTPYTIGRWCWYPGFGYVWISGEPWGWLPYHYGEWVFEQGIGWCWIPPGAYGPWSPAVVNWYQGSGWIGWGPPSTAGAGSRGNDCPPGMRCRTIVNLEDFGNGKPVSPRSFAAVDPSQLRRVRTPDVPTSSSAMLPGPAVPEATNPLRLRFAGAPAQSEAEAPTGVRSPGVSSAYPPTSPVVQSGVVFDPVGRRYVNAPGTPPAPAATAIGRGAAAPRSVWTTSAINGTDNSPDSGEGPGRRPSLGQPAPSPSPESHVSIGTPGDRQSPSHTAGPASSPRSFPSQGPLNSTNSGRGPSYSAPAPGRGTAAGGGVDGPGGAFGAAGGHESTHGNGSFGGRSSTKN